MFFFFFKQKTAYEMRISDGGSDVCSSDLAFEERGKAPIRMAGPTPPEPPTPTAPTAPAKPKTTPARRRRAVPGDPGAELPLVPPSGPTEPASTPSDDGRASPPPQNDREEEASNQPPPLELFGKPAGFRLRQHGRHDGTRNAARPA